MIRLACVACLAVVAAGCLDHKVCNQAGVGAAIPEQQLRNPANGQCQSFGNPYPCDSQCGPCPAYGAGVAQPDWGACYGACESLAEAQCLATANCHAAYSDDPTPSPVFWGCWELPPSGVQHGACTGLDAQTCSEHDDCVSLYTGPVNQPAGFVPSFERCQDKPLVSCAAVDCGTGNECVVTPNPNSTVACEPISIGGGCNGTVTCASVMPACPTGSTAGIANGCYTGFCIPNAECAPLPCAQLPDETSCKARTDCDPIYNGTNCTCDKNGCTCQTETYVRCQ